MAVHTEWIAPETLAPAVAIKMVRKIWPDAAIIRPYRKGEFLVFDRADDAISHPSTEKV